MLRQTPRGSAPDLGSRWGRGAWGRSGGGASRDDDGGRTPRGRGGWRRAHSNERTHTGRPRGRVRAEPAKAPRRAAGGQSRAEASYLIVHDWRPPRPRARVALAAAVQQRPAALIVCRGPPPPPLRAARPPAALNRKPPPARAAQRPRAPSRRLGPGLADGQASKPVRRPENRARGGTSGLVGARRATVGTTKSSANRKQAPQGAGGGSEGGARRALQSSSRCAPHVEGVGQAVAWCLRTGPRSGSRGLVPKKALRV